MKPMKKMQFEKKFYLEFKFLFDETFEFEIIVEE